MATTICVLTNSAWPNAVFVGAADSEALLAEFQSNDPLRGYQVERQYSVADPAKAEGQIHDALSATRIRKDGKWFKATIPEIIEAILKCNLAGTEESAG